MRYVLIILNIFCFYSSARAAEIKLFPRPNTHQYTIDINGDIAVGDARKFVAELVHFTELSDKDARLVGVTINSEGGSTNDAMMIANLVNGSMPVVAYGKCLSACPIILFAASSPAVVNSFVKIGVHRVYREGLKEDVETHATTREIMAAFKTRGVSPRVIDGALMSGPKEMYYLSKSDMIASGVSGAGDK